MRAINEALAEVVEGLDAKLLPTFGWTDDEVVKDLTDRGYAALDAVLEAEGGQKAETIVVYRLSDLPPILRREIPTGSEIEQ